MREGISDRYLEIALRVLSYRAVPMNCKDIIVTAQKLSIIPKDLTGKTQHKTLNARISTDIIKKGDRSNFFRVSPGVFYLRAFINNINIDAKYKVEYKAIRRKEQLKNERILCVNDSVIENWTENNGFFIEESDHPPLLDDSNWNFIRRKEVKLDKKITEVVFYIVITRPNEVLSFTKGKYYLPDSEAIERKCIGLSGNIEDCDYNLLNRNIESIRHKAARELCQTFDLLKYYQDSIILERKINLFGFITNLSNDKDKKQVGVVLKIEDNNPQFLKDVKRRDLTINSPRWISTNVPPNDLQHFEPWSQLIFNNIYLKR